MNIRFLRHTIRQPDGRRAFVLKSGFKSEEGYVWLIQHARGPSRLNKIFPFIITRYDEKGWAGENAYKTLRLLFESGRMHILDFIENHKGVFR